MNHANAPHILKEVLSIAPDAWLFGGTLLGPIRNGKIFPWDRDIDLGILSEDATEDLIERFRDAGFFVYGIYRLNMPEMKHYIPKEAMGRIGKFILRKDEVKVEMCCFTPGVDGLMYYASGTPRFFVMPEDYTFPQKKLRIYDFEANVPEESEQNLSFVYGPQWRTPRENWYFTADHYLCRERTIIELRPDDGSRWSKWTGRKVIAQKYPDIVFPEDINEPATL